MKKDITIAELFQLKTRSEELTKIYERQQQELAQALLAQKVRQDRLQARIDLIQLGKEQEHLDLRQRAMIRATAFPAIEGRMYQLKDKIVQVVRKPKQDTPLWQYLSVVDLTSEPDILGRPLEIIGGYSPQSIAETLFYYHPKAIVVGGT